MKISECMSTDVQICAPDDMIRDAARMMREIDAGILPVGANDRLVGMITDRDIAIRAVADGMGPDTIVAEVMSKEVHYCFEDQEFDAVSEQMGDLKVRRLPVLNRDKWLVGIVSLGDMSQFERNSVTDALSEISEPGGKHSQH